MSNLIEAWRVVAAKDTILSIEHHIDEDGELDDWYGKFTDNPSYNDNYYVDRKLGVLFCGESKTTVETFTSEEAMNNRMDELDELDQSYEELWTPLTVTYTVTTLPVSYHENGRQFPPRFGYSERTETTTFKTESEYRQFFGQYVEDIKYSIDEETRGEWQLEVSGATVLATNLEHMYERNSYRYQVFQSGYGHFPDKPWSECTPEVQAEHIKYMTSVYERTNQYFKNYWAYIGLVAEVHWKGEEIGHASVWHMEDDMGDEGTGQYERELISEALSAAVAHFAAESKRYGVEIVPPAELVELEKLTYDELKPLYDALRQSTGPWHPAWGKNVFYGTATQYSVHSFISDLDDEERALYEGTELEGEDVENN